jgi:flagellar motor switch protein FliM
MSAPAHHLGRARIGQLLAAVGSTHATDEAPPQTTPYDWRDPHSFDESQRNRLAQVWGQIAPRMAEIFTHTRGSPCEVSVKAFTQHYAGDLCRRLELDQDYCLTFGPDKGLPCGFVSLASKTASAWVTWLLGDSESARDPNKALSSLEESILSDLVTTVLEAFLAPLRAPQSPGTSPTTDRTRESLRPAGPFGKGQPSLQFERSEEVARVVFEGKGAKSGEPFEIAFLLPCSHLAASAGKTATATAAKASPQELSRMLMEHLQEVPVTLQATLAATTLTFQEILDLSPGDILLLGKPVAGPAELILNGRVAFRGRLARAQGRYALVIVEGMEGGDPQRVTTKGAK